MKAIQTPRLADGRVHYVIYWGYLTADKRLAIVNNLREYIGLDDKFDQEQADSVIRFCTRHDNFEYKVTDSGQYDIKYDGGSSLRGTQFLRIHKLIDHDLQGA